MTDCRGHRRNTSWANTALPPIFYEPEQETAATDARVANAADDSLYRRSFRTSRDSLTIPNLRPRSVLFSAANLNCCPVAIEKGFFLNVAIVIEETATKTANAGALELRGAFEDVPTLHSGPLSITDRRLLSLPASPSASLLVNTERTPILLLARASRRMAKASPPR
jgi:hypothetical protein